jgi:hypothetical protein
VRAIFGGERPSVHAGAGRAAFMVDPIPLHSYKAKERPTVKTEDFIDAVRSSTLSDEAKAEWIEAVAAEEATKGVP